MTGYAGRGVGTATGVVTRVFGGVGGTSRRGAGVAVDI